MSALQTFEYRLTDLAIRGLLGLALRMPYHWRVPFLGWVVARVIGRLTNYHKRACTHLAAIYPDWSPAQVSRTATACLNNAGRTLIENYSTKDFLARLAHAELEGPGLAALEEAVAEKRPVILQTGHFGNYEAVRAALYARGIEPGGIYREMHNPFFHEHYLGTMEAYGGPAFARGLPGMRGVLRHLKSGGQLIILNDQHDHGAPVLNFFGRPAHTALSPAELALRFNALVVPYFGVRQPDGLNFRCILEAPIPHSDPTTMTQEMNDRLEARIRETPEQWFWVPRRWRA